MEPRSVCPFGPASVIFLCCHLQYFPDHFVHKEILNFNIRYVNHTEGCAWIGKVSTLEVISWRELN